MDALCDRMENMMERFDELVGGLGVVQHGVQVNPITSHYQMNQSTASKEPLMDDLMFSDASQEPESNERGQMLRVDTELEPAEEEEDLSGDEAHGIQDHVMTRDSYGKLRYA